MAISRILADVATYSPEFVTVTGGEPLAQKGCLQLLRELCDLGYRVSLETSGALDIKGVDSRVMRVVDIKTPGSGEVRKNRWANIALIGASDEIKFVLRDEADYQWAKEIISTHDLLDKCPVLFSPVHGTMDPTELAEWILRDRLQVRMQVQLHKHLWKEAVGH